MERPLRYRAPVNKVNGSRNTVRNRIITGLAFPVVYFLNRPSLKWLDDAIFDFALRCNGFAIGFPGRHGLSYAEERFLKRHSAAFSDGVLFDVGANHGSYTKFLSLLAPQSRIYSFEPHPATFASLQSRVTSTNVTLVNKAVSDEIGICQLHDFAKQDGSTQASLARESVELFDRDVITHAVSVTTLDTFMSEARISKINFLKIDTEGFDINVLRGARNALERGAIKMIQFEFIPADIAMRVSMRDFFELLGSYSLYRLCLNGSLLPLETYSVKRCEVYVTHNIVAIHNEAQAS